MADPKEPGNPARDAELRQIFVSAGHDYWGRQGEGRMQHGIQSLAEVECVAGKGLRGDRYFDVRPDYKGQVTFLDESVVAEVRAFFRLPKLPASVFRRNLIVSGVYLARCKGRSFELQGITFEGSQECTPCDWMDRVIAPGARDFLRTNFRGGLRAKILTDGRLRIG